MDIEAKQIEAGQNEKTKRRAYKTKWERDKRQQESEAVHAEKLKRRRTRYAQKRKNETEQDEQKRKQIQKLRMQKWRRNQPTCSICTKQSVDSFLSPCGHKFHKDCLENWLKIKSNCPNCRQEAKDVRMLKTGECEKVEHVRSSYSDANNEWMQEYLVFEEDSFIDCDWCKETIPQATAISFEDETICRACKDFVPASDTDDEEWIPSGFAEPSHKRRRMTV